MTGRSNDIRAKRLRTRLRATGAPCHACGSDIDYTADHLDPLSFQADHRWPVSLGGPEYDYDNLACAHRACNRARSNTIDSIAITAAAEYGITLNPDPTTTQTLEPCAPDGQPCHRCNGTHNQAPGVTFVTSRDWWTNAPADLDEPGPTPPPDSPYVWS